MGDRNEEEVSVAGEAEAKPEGLAVSDEVADKKEDAGVSGGVGAGAEVADKEEEEVSVTGEVDVKPEEVPSGKIEDASSSGDKISQAEVDDAMMVKTREEPAGDDGGDVADKPEDDVAVAGEVKPEEVSGEVEVKSDGAVAPADGKMSQAEVDATIKKMKEKKTD